MHNSISVAVLTTGPDMVDLIQSATRDYGFDLLHFQEVENFWKGIEDIALEDVIIVLDGRLDSAPALSEEISEANYLNHIVIVPYDSFKILYSRIVGVTVLVQPVEVQEIQEIIQEFIPSAVLSEPPVEELVQASTEITDLPTHQEELEPAAETESSTGLHVETPQRVGHPLYSESIDIVHTFLHDHRHGRESPIKPVTTIAESLVRELTQSSDLCLEILEHVPDFENADQYMASHHVNVAVIAGKMGLGGKLTEEERFELILTALVHDVGMTQLPEELITRQGKLSDSEYAEIRQHPIYGREILQHYGDNYPWLPQVVFQEHERYDGSGYPEGIDSFYLHQYAALIGLADTYNAFTHVRPFRDQMLPFSAVQQLIRFSNQLFSGDVVKAFIIGMGLYPVGSHVELNTGELCMIVGTNEWYPLRPVVKVLATPDGERVEDAPILDLKEEPQLTVTEARDHRIVPEN
jgi:HD-GYP domain-containing protein (c-di-GMP phosphodiesterase class II)